MYVLHIPASRFNWDFCHWKTAVFSNDWRNKTVIFSPITVCLEDFFVCVIYISIYKSFSKNMDDLVDLY